MATRSVGTPSRPASSEVAVRIVSMHTAGGSGWRFPEAGPGKSTRSTVTPSAVTASSIATSPDWSRLALAPGVSTRPAGLDPVIGPRSAVDPSPSTVASRTAAVAQPRPIAVERVEGDSDGVLFGFRRLIGRETHEVAQAGGPSRVVPRGLAELKGTQVLAVG